MGHFNNIRSLAGLKKEYRRLALENHPDRGGDENKMKEINAEFERLFEVWKNRPETEDNGYESDYASATAREYTGYVYNEYKWAGENFKKHQELDKGKIKDYVREFLKETYPSYKFSVRGNGYNTICVSLMAADFYPYNDHAKLRGDVNKYWFEERAEKAGMTDRCVEVFRNIINYVESWNFDDSDSMTDYFHVNFYTDFEIGQSGRSFEYRPISLKGKEPVYRRKVGPVEKSVKEAMGAGNAFLQTYKWVGDERVLDTDGPFYLCKDDENHYPLWISQPSLLRKRLDKLAAVGIEAKGTRRGIVLVGYSEELKAAIAKEKEEEDAREKAFYETRDGKAEEVPAREEKVQETKENGLSLVDYSEKAFAIIGETRNFAAKLKALGGRFNWRLTCGPGWVFPKRKETEVREALCI